jgi:hypothetical protein
LQSCPITATPVRTLEWQRSRAMCPPKHDPAKPHCFLTHCSLNPEDGRTNVFGGNTTTGDRSQCACTWPATRSRYSAMGQGHPKPAKPSLTQTTLGQLCAASWVSRSWPAVTQPGIKPGSVVTPQALRCSALDCYTPREAPIWPKHLECSPVQHYRVKYSIMHCTVLRRSNL